MVAAVCAWHERHQDAAAAFTHRLDRGETLIVPGPALIETYAVLTRLPPPHRLSATHAWTLIESNFVRNGKIAALSAPEYPRLLSALATRNETGGRVFDSLIAASARRGSATVLLTFNPRHFEDSESLSIVEPASDR